MSQLLSGGTEIVDTEAMKWESGNDVIARMAPAFREGLGGTEHYRKYHQKALRTDPVTGRRADEFRMEPGYSDSGVAYHDCAEECFVIQGEMVLPGEGPLLEGEYFWRPPGWVHGAASESGCRALLFLEGPTDGGGPVTRKPRPASEAGTNPLHANMETGVGGRGWVRRLDSALLPWIPGASFARSEDGLSGYDLDAVSFKVLSKNMVSGWQTLLLRLAPGYKQADRGSHSATQQWFVLEGSVLLSDRVMGKGTYVYRPAGAVESALRSADGALLLMKVDGRLDFRLTELRGR